ncbi:hypothetical protein CEXT_695571 [Caerostris extrusa]|uniref:Uncharacterized protein n=1 Tax=Caerostris extrusa TaxID=172846 RepID=A0AAV4VQM9_CAEEX|nr:hypothetical protein CEXT_695571 [Caerostris extrusa]
MGNMHQLKELDQNGSNDSKTDSLSPWKYFPTYSLIMPIPGVDIEVCTNRSHFENPLVHAEQQERSCV